ncbi:histone-fold-containing protein [Trametes coccinea BRFM310]|uniref:DNA polymerase epsilon subunit D n=1 Tax=Trametes coccinea (strain BRFM310) TaxID=1353009 RepID=A0A1Y2IBP2_TRAC3|nr:histone-fold-containing protein [Trametes coccinea BRFM310]
MPRPKEPSGSSALAQAQQDAAADGIESFELPRSVVMKLARASQVPENTKFSKDVVLAILKASTVFINYLAATAHEVASSKQHKSISATDVLKALELVEFGDIAKNIQGDLQVYRELQKADKKKGGKGKSRDAGESTSTASKPKSKAKAASAPEEPQQQRTIPPIHIRPPSGQPTTATPSEEVETDEHGQSEEVDEDQDMMDQDEEGVEDVEDEDLEDDEEDDEEGEPEDPMALEEAELRRDARDIDEDA